jgi:hypothetical protein
MGQTPSKHTRRATPRLAALVLAASAAALACKKEAPPPPRPVEAVKALAAIVASAASVVGTVEVHRPGGGWEAVQPGSVFRVGDEVRTGTLSTARVEFVAGGGLELEELALVVIDAAPPAPAQAGQPAPAPDTRVAVKEGVVRGFLPEAPAQGAAPGIVVATGDGAEVRLAARPGEKAAFRLTRKEGGTELAVTGGRATLRGAGGEATLVSGQATVASAAGLTEAAELIEFPPSVEPGIDARFQLVPELSVRLAWKPVPGATAYRVQVARDLSFQRPFMGVTVEGTEVSFAPREAGMYAWRVASVDGGRRQGEYGFARRLYCELSPPRDLLVAPADGATVRFVEAPPTLEFAWEAPGEARPCRIVLASGPDLLRESAVTEIVTGQRAELRIPAPGEYRWGVYVETEAGPRPIFAKPRRLVVQKLSRPRAELPRALSRWGE